jgi:hypothetical protein
MLGNPGKRTPHLLLRGGFYAADFTVDSSIVHQPVIDWRAGRTTCSLLNGTWFE